MQTSKVSLVHVHPNLCGNDDSLKVDLSYLERMKSARILWEAVQFRQES